ncbi:hypothetical protein RIF25_09440 [Thermosynechococcaceae cyanobacterium BACA0444]|uniref:Uncharacterized protein n=1 Tax=Pseudocalidococcus azoricus BACA0444 TaxID=2918990 RepID=A0AAE4FRZ5_9CYAN|nr:hypothetical protein [Pseudocalidococcus azoricus]MDS3861031.1 hypothetical protein [Pseudocalidococcus azoricus BACA0444]
MGKYITKYFSDFGFVYGQVEIEVYLVIDGVSQSSSYDFETALLPQVWRNWCLTPEKMSSLGLRGVCQPPYGQLREAQLTLAEGMELRIPVPWRGNDSRFTQFFQDVSINSSVLFTAIKGEVIGAFFTELHSR